MSDMAAATDCGLVRGGKRTQDSHVHRNREEETVSVWPGAVALRAYRGGDVESARSEVGLQSYLGFGGLIWH
jgi:hypothetical protein